MNVLKKIPYVTCSNPTPQDFFQIFDQTILIKVKIKICLTPFKIFPKIFLPSGALDYVIYGNFVLTFTSAIIYGIFNSLKILFDILIIMNLSPFHMLVKYKTYYRKPHFYHLKIIP